ncbi:MAG: hypothetical protein KBG70_14660, partial [Chitinophagales bacterium]|nr:hypothetical protein [Chitinophagales bacterium]
CKVKFVCEKLNIDVKRMHVNKSTLGFIGNFIRGGKENKCKPINLNFVNFSLDLFNNRYKIPIFSDNEALFNLFFITIFCKWIALCSSAGQTYYIYRRWRN